MNNLEQVIVISLKSSKERREVFSKLNKHVDYVYFDAVVGAELDDSITKNESIFSKNLNFNKGAMGNALSHISLWRYCVENDCSLTVAEDDCFFREDFHLIKSKLLGNENSDWDLISWGWNFDSPIYLNILKNISDISLFANQDQLRINTNKFLECKEFPKILPLRYSCGLPAYSITPTGAKKFLENCLPLSNINRYSGDVFNNIGLDLSMSTVYPYTNSFVCLPPIAGTHNSKLDSSANPDVKR